MAPFQPIPFHSIPFRSRPFDSIVPQEYIRHYVRTLTLTSIVVKAFLKEFRRPKNFVYQSYVVCHAITIEPHLYSIGCFSCAYNGRKILLRGNTKRTIRKKRESHFGKFICQLLLKLNKLIRLILCTYHMLHFYEFQNVSYRTFLWKLTTSARYIYLFTYCFFICLLLLAFYFSIIASYWILRRTWPRPYFVHLWRNSYVRNRSRNVIVTFT